MTQTISTETITIVTVKVRVGTHTHNLTYAQAEELFQSLGRLLTSQKREININPLMELVSKEFGVSRERMESRNRSAIVSRARQVVMYLLYELTPLSLEDIGKLFGERDHGTVLWAYRRIQGFMKSYPDTWAPQIEKLKVSSAPFMPPSLSMLPMNMREKSH